MQTAYHVGVRTLLPRLCHPHRRRIDTLHLAHYGFARRPQVHILHAAALVEGVHAVEIGLAVKTLLLLIVQCGDFGEAWVGGQ